MEIALKRGDTRGETAYKLPQIIKSIGEGNFTSALQDVRQMWELRERQQIRKELVARCCLDPCADLKPLKPLHALPLSRQTSLSIVPATG
jgi:hypothetical protein